MPTAGILGHSSQTCHSLVPPMLLFTEYLPSSLLVDFFKFHVQRKPYFTTKHGKTAVPAMKDCSRNKEPKDRTPRLLNPSQMGDHGSMALNLGPGCSGLRREISEG